MLLIIDNFDSFTYNLYHYFLILGQDVVVKNRDEIDINWIEKFNPQYIVLSPGPGKPWESQLALEVIDRYKNSKPILGVCLGHQCIAYYFGAKIIKANSPMHGKISLVKHNNKGVFHGLKNPLNVTRYHSLIVSNESMPDNIEITAATEANEIMAIRHKKYRIEGIQFHPEAYLTQQGLKLLNNFLRSK